MSNHAFFISDFCRMDTDLLRKYPLKLFTNYLFSLQYYNNRIGYAKKAAKENVGVSGFYLNRLKLPLLNSLFFQIN